MKIAFVAPTPPDLAAFGVRTLSAFLKQHGHACRCVFLPGGVEKYKYGSRDGYRYEARIVDQVLDLCRGHDLIALSFMSNYLDRASQLSHALREGMKVPLVVGGIHPTVLPEPCLEFADIVCVGEGEEALLELVQRIEAGHDYADVRNLWLRRDGQIVRNPVRPLIEDLDRRGVVQRLLPPHALVQDDDDARLPAPLHLLRGEGPQRHVQLARPALPPQAQHPAPHGRAGVGAPRAAVH
jgi:anaerobic magnesium-protoporphyrin IX monomethyl ester cyclase